MNSTDRKALTKLARTWLKEYDKDADFYDKAIAADELLRLLGGMQDEP